jgi:hypothetical protein
LVARLGGGRATVGRDDVTTGSSTVFAELAWQLLSNWLCRFDDPPTGRSSIFQGRSSFGETGTLRIAGSTTHDGYGVMVVESRKHDHHP